MARRRWNIETIKQVVAGEQPFIQVGYESSSRKEGEIWKDSKGRKWQKKNGYKVQISSSDTPILDELNEASKCSICGTNVRAYGNKLDHKVFPKTGKCFDCLQDEEMILRATGKWESYEKMKILKYKRGVLKDFKEKVMESINYLKNDSGKIGEIMSDGKLMTWTGKCNSQWLTDAENDLIKVNTELIKTDEEIIKFETELKK
jgi:hypothetical protein